MSQSDRAIKKLATDLARIKHEVVSWRGAQADFTSIENGGNFTFKDGDGNVTAIMGGQDDGSNTIRHVDGPTPPIPSGLSAHVDGPIVQVSWDGTFESNVTHDWHYLEVLAVGPNNEQLTGTINDLSGGETSLAATSQGDWVITARSVSRAGKRSLDGDAGTVAVQLVGLTGAIDAIQESANGKNTIYYSPTEPDAPDGGFNNGDLWFDTSEEGNNTASVWDGNGWVSMEDARLATIIAAQEALESDLQDVQTSVDGKNKITYDPALPPASYVGAVGDTWYRTSGNSMIGFWKWDGAAWVQQELSTTVIPQIDIGAGTFGALKGTRLEAGSVTTDKLLVGDFSNLVDDPALLGPGWSGNVSYSFVYTLQGPGNALFYSGVDGGYVQNGNMFPTMPGTKYVVTARVQNRRTEWVKIHVNWFQHDKTPSAVSESDGVTYATTAPSAVWSDVEAVVSAPSDARFGVLRVTYHSGGGAAYVIRPMVRRQVGRTVIENGAITTDKLAVGSITAESGIIESLDLGTATVGELDGIRIMGQTVRGEQLSGDAIDGKVITGANIRTSQTGARVQMDVSGLRVFDASNDQVVQLPSDGTAATFNGELVAQSLTSTGRASFLAEDNRLEPGAGLVLAAGVGDPPSPPVVSNHYKQITPPALVDGESVAGLAYGDGLFWRAVDAGNGNDDLDRIEGIDRNGVIQRTIPLVDFWARNGLVVIGDELFALGSRDDRPANVRNQERWVRVYGLDGTYKRQWEYPNYGTGTYQPGIGSTPAGNVSIAQCWVDGKLSWRTFSPTGTLINTTTRDAPVKSDAVGIYGGTADFGATRTVFAKGFTPGTNRQFTVYGSNGNDYFPEQSWYSPDRGDVKGLAWDGAKFYSIDTAGVITEYGSLNMGDDSANWWATYRWVGDGGKTTRIAPPARFAWARRSRARVTAPNLPQGVTTIEPSLAFKVTTPARSDFTSPAWVAGDTPATVNYEALDPYWYVGSPPGDVNNFPNSTPSNIKAASGLFEVKGDGSGMWGPLTFNTNGTIKGATDAGTAIVPINAANSNRTLAVTFTTGRFKTPPTVVATPVTPDPQTVQVSVSNITATGFTMVARRTVASDAYVTWVATEG